MTTINPSGNAGPLPVPISDLEIAAARKAYLALQPTIRTVLKQIVSTPNVCGGSARIDGTRIPVWLIVDHVQQGWGEDELLQAFPMLTRSHLLAAHFYNEFNRHEIDREIHENAVEFDDGNTEVFHLGKS